MQGESKWYRFEVLISSGETPRSNSTEFMYPIRPSWDPSGARTGRSSVSSKLYSYSNVGKLLRQPSSCSVSQWHTPSTVTHLDGPSLPIRHSSTVSPI